MSARPVATGDRFRFLGDYSNEPGIAEVTGLAHGTGMARVELNGRTMFVPVALFRTARWVRL